MGLSNDLISRFVKATKDEKPTVREATVLGTVVYDGRTFVKLDGSDQLTPVTTTADVTDGERVTVLIKDHTATITGNMSSPSAKSKDVQEIGSQISEFEIVIADKVSTEIFEAESARIDELVAYDLTVRESLSAHQAEITNLKAKDVEIEGTLTAQDAAIENLETTKLDAEVADLTYATIEKLEAAEADIYTLESTYADFEVATTNKLTAVEADISDLDAKKLDAEEAEITYANIDFSNIGKAAFEYFYAQSGLIENVVVGDGTVTGNLVGVTIKGDLIEGNTIVADKLVIQGEDGLYYKLNFDGGTFAEGEQVPTDSLHGSVITANSITAEKISVKDLVAFDATIGGFNITDSSIYSGVKESVNNTTRGIYMDNDGQIAVGDSNNYVKYYKDTDGSYRLTIRVGHADGFEMGARNLIRNSTNLMFADYYFDISDSAIVGSAIVGLAIVGKG